MSFRVVGEHLRMLRGGGPAPGAAGPRHGAAPRPGLSGSASFSGRRPECNWWGADRQQQASTPRPTRQQRSRVSRPPARAPPTGNGNRELVRRALAPPASRGALRRWSFRPAPSRLRNGSEPVAPVPASGLATAAAVMISSCA